MSCNLANDWIRAVLLKWRWNSAHPTAAAPPQIIRLPSCQMDTTRSNNSKTTNHSNRDTFRKWLPYATHSKESPLFPVFMPRCLCHWFRVINGYFLFVSLVDKRKSHFWGGNDCLLYLLAKITIQGIEQRDNFRNLSRLTISLSIFKTLKISLASPMLKFL